MKRIAANIYAGTVDIFISSSAYILYLTGTAGAVMDVTDYDLRYYVSENTEAEKEEVYDGDCQEWY